MKRAGNHAPKRRRGFSLLEVILALAILAGAIAVLGEVSSMGMRNARLAKDLTYAQLLCESKLAEIVAGIESATAQQGTPLGTVSDSSEPDWLYSVETTPASQTGLVKLQVTVYKELPGEKHPPRFSLTCWIPDPDATTKEDSTSSDTTTSASSSGGSQ